MTIASDLKIRSLQGYILDEVTRAMGFSTSGLVRKVTGWALSTPAYRFSSMFAAADEACKAHGFRQGAQVVLDGLMVKVHACGAEHIPFEGPVLIASNHPGGYDSICIASQVPRDDIKVLAAGVNFLKRLEALRRSLILVPYTKSERFAVINDLIDQLKSRSALLHFGSGTHDPDPEAQSGSLEQISQWFRTLEVLLRKVPETKLCLTAVSGVLEPKYLRHPATMLRKDPVDKRRLAEMMEILNILFTGKPPKQTVHISFDEPATLSKLSSDSAVSIMDAIKTRQRALMQRHLEWLRSMDFPALA